MKANQCVARCDVRRSRGRERPDSGDDVGLGHQRVDVVGELRAGLAIVVVAVACSNTGAALDDHSEPVLNQCGNDRRHEGNALLMTPRLKRYTNGCSGHANHSLAKACRLTRRTSGHDSRDFAYQRFQPG